MYLYPQIVNNIHVPVIDILILKTFYMSITRNASKIIHINKIQDSFAILFQLFKFLQNVNNSLINMSTHSLNKMTISTYTISLMLTLETRFLATMLAKTDFVLTATDSDIYRRYLLL